MLPEICRFALLWITLSMVAASDKETNVIFNKTVLQIGRYPGYRQYLNDDSSMTCLDFGEEYKKLIVYDLGRTYKINRIVISNGDYRASKPASIYLGQEYTPCKFHSQIAGYSLCNEFHQETWESEFKCKEGSNKGRYLIVMKGNVFEEERSEPLSFCEIRAFGKEATDIPIDTRPEIQSESLPPITKSHFKIAPVLRKDVPTLEIPNYSNAVIYINKNCEPIIYDIATHYAFGVACTSENGKSRIVAFAKYGYFQGIFKNPATSQFKSNLQSWLSPDVKDAQYIVSTSIKTMQDFDRLVKPGVIVYFEVSDKYTDEIVDALRDALVKGTISMAIDVTFWSASSSVPKTRNFYMKILDVFNLDYYKTYITWASAIQSPMPDTYYNENLLDLEDRVQRMSKNHELLIKDQAAVSKKLTEYPAHMVKHSKLGTHFEKILRRYEKLLEWICPCEFQQTTATEDKALLRLMGEIMKSQTLANTKYKPPCVDLFPGDFELTPKKSEAKLTVNGITASTRNPTGYYLEAGGTLKFSVSKITGTWTMSIGCHTDNLPDSLKGWTRYPNIYTSHIPVKDEGEIFSPFGGVLWLVNEAVNTSITLTISNVIPTPFFNLRSKNAVEDWNKQRKNPGLWAQIAGDSIVFCESSAKVRQFDGAYLENLLKNTWDPIVRMEMLLTATDWKTHRPEIAVLDIQISYGYGHSGYPIELYPTWFPSIFNATYLEHTGSWGMCHEIGHNLQRAKWTFSGTTDVTNNVMCLLVFDKIFKISRFGLDLKSLTEKKQNIVDYLDNGADFAKWKSDYWTALVVYAQLVHHMGWGFYRDNFAYYEKNNISPATDDAKIATFINVSSIVSKQDLTPIFDFWGFPIKSNLADELSKLPCFFPEDDLFSSMSPKRTKQIKEKYPNCHKKSLYFEDYVLEPLIKGNRPNFIEELDRRRM